MYNKYKTKKLTRIIREHLNTLGGGAGSKRKTRNPKPTIRMRMKNNVLYFEITYETKIKTKKKAKI